jgi:zinc protease
MSLIAAILTTGCGTPVPDHMVLLPVKDDPTISFRFCFKVGSQCDPAGKEGLAALTAAMMTRGATELRSWPDLLDALYPMAASYEASVDKEMTIISGRVHGDNLDEFYQLFIEAILHPAFNEDDFRRIRTDMINSIQKTLRYSNDEELGKAALYHAVFEDTPYAHPATGTVTSLKSLTIDDVRSFYKKWYTGDNVVIGIGGSYDEALLERIELDIGKLPVGAPQQPGLPAPRDIEGLNVLLIEKDCDATAISIGFPISVLRGDDDFWPLFVFNSWFGEHRNSSSHLYQIIREARGMNYGDYSYIEHFANGGRRQMPAPNHARRQQIFEIWLRPVQHEHRHFVIRAALRELRHVIDSGMTREQLDLTKRFLDTYALHYARTTSERLGYAIDSRFYNIKGDYINELRKRLRRVSLNDVNNAIRKHLNDSDMHIVAVTRGAGVFADSLAADAASPVRYATPKPDEILAEDDSIAVYPLRIDREKIRIVKVEKVLE